MLDLDVHLFRWLHDALSAGWLGPMAVLSVIGGGWGSVVALPLFAAVRTRRLAGSLVAVLLTTATLVFVLKRLVARVRPFAALPGMKALVFAPPTDFSFPSGHAAGSFAFAVFFAVVLVKATPSDATAQGRTLRIAAAAGMVALAAGVGLSRIALGVHFPGDVLAGAAIGSAIGAVGAWLHLASARAAERAAGR